MNKSIEESLQRIPSPQDVLWGEDEQALLDLCVEALCAAKSKCVFVPFNEREFSLWTIDEVVIKLKWSKTQRVTFWSGATCFSGGSWVHDTDPAGWELDKQILRGESAPKEGITLVPCRPLGQAYGSGTSLTERRIHLDVPRGKVKLSGGQGQYHLAAAHPRPLILG